MQIFRHIGESLKGITDIRESIDTAKAAENIRQNIHFKGPNVWILACAVILASVGLNINSAPVIIGAMLISPLMGPIFGIGLGLGIDDTQLIRSSAKNLFIMVAVCILAGTVYFLVTPLKLANPTELMARTNPTIYDVLVALFGGLAGIFEMSRKEKGTVISGVAIATTLLPPLCTIGYGISIGSLTFIIGPLYLFCINCIFIILATYIMVKYLKFKEVEFQDKALQKRTKTIMSVVIIFVIVPSIWSAINMIRENGFKINVEAFVEENKHIDSGYIYDHVISYRKGGSVEIFIAGGPLPASEKARLIESAGRHKIRESQLKFTERAIFDDDKASESLMQSIYERTDNEISKREATIRELRRELAEYQKDSIPYGQIAKEIRSQYPEMETMFIARGAKTDSTVSTPGLLVVAKSSSAVHEKDIRKLEDWLKIRLSDSTATVICVK